MILEGTGRRLGLVALGVSLLGGSQSALAARLPEWAKAIAADAPPVEQGVHETPSRILFSETRVAVEADGSRRIRRRFASQALSMNAGEVGIGGFPLREKAKIEASRAWHLPPGARAVKSYDPPVELALRSSFLTDARTRIVSVGGVRRGSLIFFEFEAVDVPVALAWSQSFAEGAPVAVARFELETPPGWTLRTEWLRREGPAPLVQGDVRTWELRDLPFTPPEPLGEPAAAAAPRIIVNILPPPGAIVEPVTLVDWAAMSSWWEALAAGRDRVTPGISAEAARLYGQAGSGFYERVRAASAFVRDIVRYLDVEIGIGGYRPHPASETLSNFYGDCKDKTTLLRALLSAGGIVSYPVAVNARSRGTVARSVPAIDAFDHMVIAVPVPPGAALPATIAPLLTDAGPLGRLLIVDATHEYVSIGAIPEYLSGKEALVVAGDTGRLVTIVAAGAESHRVDRRLDLTLAGDRAIDVSMVSRHQGQPAADARRDYRQSVAERRSRTEERILATWFDAEPLEYGAEFETADGEMIERVAWRVPAPLFGSRRTVALFPGAAEELRRTSLNNRRAAVVYQNPVTIRYETRLAGALPGTALPEAQDLRGSGWATSTHFAREPGAVVATWRIEISKCRFEPAEFAELRKLWTAVSATARAAIRLEP